MRKIIATLLIISIFLPLPLYAAKVDEKKNELKGVKSSIEISKKEQKNG